MSGIQKTAWMILVLASLSTWAHGQAGHAGHEDPRFEHISVEDGLPYAVVNCVIQDRQGFMWFGSHGLCKYDGRRIKVYKPRIPNPGAMLFDVRVIHEGNDGILWVGTEEAGLARFDPLTETFTVYQYNQYDPTTLSAKSISAVAMDGAGNLWVGTGSHGINRLDPKTEQITRYPFNREDSSGLYGRSVKGICEDAAGRIWVATGRGLSRLNPSTDQFTHYEDNRASTVNSWPRGITSAYWDEADGRFLIGTGEAGLYDLSPSTEALLHFRLDEHPATASGQVISALYQDRAGQTWLGTRDGLLHLTKDFQIVQRYRHNPSDVRSLGHNHVRCIHQDRSGMIWVGTAKGVSRFDPEPQPLTTLSPTRDAWQERPFNSVASIAQDSSGGLWFGTWGEGLLFLDPQTEQWHRFQHDPADPGSLANNTAKALHASRKRPELLWIGLNQKGLEVLNRSTGQITHLRDVLRGGNSLSDGRINCLFEDRDGILWIGTWFGLNWLDQATYQCGRYQPDATDPNLAVPVHLTAIQQDTSGALWIGTSKGGLYRLDTASDQFTRYLSDPKNPHSLSHDHIRSVFNDSQGRLWIATRDGLSRYDPESDSFVRYLCSNFPYGEQDWSHRNDIQGILEDNRGYLWAGSRNGLHVLSDILEAGFQARHVETLSSYRLGACRCYARLKAEDGTLYFGTTNGLFAVRPDRMRKITPPEVVLTDLKLFNKSVPIASQGTPLKSHISTCKEIALSHAERVITFDFAALDYVDPGQNQYTYRLKGLDDEWVNLGHQASVTFTDLDPGDYVFHVKAANSDGIWNEAGTSVALIITPFWWETIWFRIVVIGLIVGGVMVALEGHVQLAKARRRSLEAKVVERTSELRAARDELSLARDNLGLQVQERTAQLQQEIAGREHVQKTLEESEAKLRGFIDGSEDAICLRDRNRRLILWNKAFARSVKTNFGVDVCAGMRAEDYVPKDVLAQYNEQRKRLYPALEGKQTRAEFALPCPDGTTHHLDVRWTPVRVRGDIVAIAEETRDVTHEKISQERLRGAQEKYRTVADFTHDWEYWEGPDGRLIYVSPSCESITGYKPEAFLDNQCNVDTLILPEDKSIWDHHRSSQAEREDQEGIQFRIRTRAGEVRWIEHVCRPVSDEAGRSLGRRGSNRDITRRRLAEDELRLLRAELAHMDRVTVTGALTAAIAHEINQPLAAVLSNAQAALRFLSQESPNLNEVRDSLKDIVDDDKRAAEVIRRLRGLLKKESPNPESIDVNMIAGEVISLVHSEAVMRHITLTTDLAEDAPCVMGDRIQIQQVILNLLVNAMDAVKEQPPKNRRVIVSSRRQGSDALEISVIDSGSGINPDDLERVFDPFHTTKSGGMGMGLAICRSIVERHGGRLWAENASAGGAKFSFMLPAE